MDVGQQIKNARIKTGLSQEDFGKLFGKSGATVSLWELGKTMPTADIKTKLTEMYGIDFGEPKPEKKPDTLKKIARKVEVKEAQKDLLLQVRVPEKYVHEMLMGGLVGVLSHCEISIMQQMEEIMVKPCVDEIEEVEVEEVEEKPLIVKTEKPEIRKVRKVIQFRCPECGGMNKRMVFRNEGTYDTVCSHCKAKYSFWDSDLEKTEYNCPNCDELNFYFSPKDVRFDFENDSCRSCGTKRSVYEILELSEVQQLMAHDYTTADGKSAFKVV